jgi:hypothetical protein
MGREKFPVLRDPRVDEAALIVAITDGESSVCLAGTCNQTSGDRPGPFDNLGATDLIRRKVVLAGRVSQRDFELVFPRHGPPGGGEGSERDRPLTFRH